MIDLLMPFVHVQMGLAAVAFLIHVIDDLGLMEFGALRLF